MGTMPAVSPFGLVRAILVISAVATHIVRVLDPVTGAAPHIWDRAVGWYFVSLVEVLDYFPKTHPGYKRTLQRFQSLAKAIKKSQDASGGWWLIMDPQYTSDPRNYIESSASAMFTYALLRGIRKGFIPANEYSEVAQSGYSLLKNEFLSRNANGTLNWEGTVEVGSLSSNGSFEVGFLLFLLG